MNYFLMQKGIIQTPKWSQALLLYYKNLLNYNICAVSCNLWTKDFGWDYNHFWDVGYSSELLMKSCVSVFEAALSVLSIGWEVQYLSQYSQGQIESDWKEMVFPSSSSCIYNFLFVFSLATLTGVEIFFWLGNKTSKINF